MNKADLVHDYFADGWDFCDAIREVAGKGSLAKVASEYKKSWGMLQDGYAMSTFVMLDKREGRK